MNSHERVFKNNKWVYANAVRTQIDSLSKHIHRTWHIFISVYYVFYMSSSIALSSSWVQPRPGKITSIAQGLFLPWREYSELSNLEVIECRVRAFLEKIMSQWPARRNAKIPVSLNSPSQIHEKFQNPSYLDGIEVRTGGAIASNDSAIADFLAIVGTHRASIIRLSESSRIRISQLPLKERSHIARHLQIVLKQLKNLSHGSGRVAGRKNGALSFSHWIEAGYLYLLYDPRPSIEGLYEVLCHDIYEDPQWYIKPTYRQDGRSESLSTIGSNTQVAFKKRFWTLIGGTVSQHIQNHFTKPPVIFGKEEIEHLSILTLPVYKDTLERFWVVAANKYLQEKEPDVYEKGQIQRNNQFIQRITQLPTREFLKKIPDLLSNLRTLDAFVLAETTDDKKEKWRAKMLRKLEEVCEYYLPRLVETGEEGYSYLVLIWKEIIGLDSAFQFDLVKKYPLYLSGNMTPERNALSRRGIRFIEIASRPLPDWKRTNHTSYELIV
jgi:hypothetical protein